MPYHIERHQRKSLAIQAEKEAIVTWPDTSAFTRQLMIDGVIDSQKVTLTPLTGGVSSEIYLVQDAQKRFVVKRALPKLNVAADWYADTSRNAMEHAYIRYVGELLPDSVPRVTYANDQAGYFVMEYLEGFINWKQDLLAGRFDVEVAKMAGRILGKIHASSWNDAGITGQFDAIENFDQLRIDPYLRATAAKHPAVSRQLLEEASRLRESRQCLMHGDYSPKNMLYQDQRLVILDCEVACHGDAAFDLAFLLNHLTLKGLYHSPQRTTLPALFEAASEAYMAEMGTLASPVLCSVTRLLPMLILARVDGKSPVEYLKPDEQAKAREFAITHILKPQTDLSTLAQRWYDQL